MTNTVDKRFSRRERATLSQDRSLARNFDSKNGPLDSIIAHALFVADFIDAFGAGLCSPQPQVWIYLAGRGRLARNLSAIAGALLASRPCYNSAMAKHLGEILYWIFSGIAFLVFSFASYVLVEELRTEQELRVGYLSFLVVAAIAALLTGRLCEYLLDKRRASA
jgi:hypothetical protein